MATAFPERAAKLSASIGRAFGEDFILTPRAQVADVNLPRAPDPGRAVLTRTGVWSAGAKEMRMHARGHADSDAQPTVASGPAVTFAEADLAWPPVEGDLCTRVLDNSTYVIGRRLPNGFGRVKFTLTARKR